MKLKILKNSKHKFIILNYRSKMYLKEGQIKTKLMELIHTKTGWGNPLRPHSECEDLYIRNIKNLPDEKQTVDFRYIFDEDGFSQYDKTHVFDGTLTIQIESIFKIDMEEIHAGVATILRYIPKEKKFLF